jgi:hypothetical protein
MSAGEWSLFSSKYSSRAHFRWSIRWAHSPSFLGRLACLAQSTCDCSLKRIWRFQQNCGLFEMECAWGGDFRDTWMEIILQDLLPKVYLYLLANPKSIK